MSKRGPGVKKAAPKTIVLPLSYVLASEKVADALAMLLDEAMSVENLKAAIAALAEHNVQEGKLTKQQRDALDIWE